ncbi:hypothetical protein BH11MYX1_BH11MYX1_44000 [soil metagenome]
MAFQLPFAGAARSAGDAASRIFGPVTSRLGRRGTRIVKWIGIVLFTLLAFLFAFQATFPIERLRDYAIEQLSANWDVTISSVDRGIIPGNLTLNGITLRSRPTRAEEPVTVIVIKQADVKAGLFALLKMRLSFDLDLTIGSPKGYGHITGNVTLPKFGKGGLKLDLAGDDLPGESLPLKSQLGLPMTGKINFAVALDLPTSKNKMGRASTDWTKVDGSLDLSCANCTLGDGHTKLKPLLKNKSQQVMVGDGIDFGEVHIASLSAHAVFTAAVGDPDAHSSGYKPGKFDITKFELKSPDGEVHIDYTMTMATTIDESIVAGCLRFKGDESLLKREEGKKTYAAISTTGAELRSDGLFHIKLTDRFKDMKRLNMECGPNAPSSKIGNGEDFSPGRGSGIMTRPTPSITPSIPQPTTPPPPPPPQANPPPPEAKEPPAPPPPATTNGAMPAPPPTEGSSANAGNPPPGSPPGSPPGTNEPPHEPTR